jgi:hypothetical protein
MNALKYYDNYIFNTPQRGIDLADRWMRAALKRVSLVNCGGSGTLGAIAISHMLGIRRLHIFGFDCCAKEKVYVEGIPSCSVDYSKGMMSVEVSGRKFKTTSSWLSFAYQFFQMVNASRQLVTIYGDSMVTAMARPMEV